MGRSKAPGEDVLFRAAQTGRRAAKVDRRVGEDYGRARGTVVFLALEDVKERPAGNTREVKEEHAESLVESIKLLGLLQPILVDRYNHLIAGGHRLRAYQILKEREGGDWNRIPAIVDQEVNAERDPELALQKELAENEKRRNLTRTEVAGAASRLIAAGYNQKRSRGRPRKDEKYLTPALAAAFGVSERHVRRLLTESEQGEQPQAQVDLSEVRVKTLSSLDRYARGALGRPELAEDEGVQAALIALRDAVAQAKMAQS